MPAPSPAWVTLRPGDTGPDVERVRAFLSSAGFDAGVGPKFDGQMLEALHAYQRANNLTVEDAAYAAPPAPDARVDEKVAEIYGYLSVYLSDPEIGPILRRAATEQWSQNRLQGALSQTNWWRSTSESARQFDMLRSSDPASAQARIDQAYAAMRGLAAQAGIVGLPDTTITELATNAVRLNWSAAQIQQALGSEALKNPTLVGNVATSQVRRLYEAYAMPVTDDAVRNTSAMIAAGRMTVEDLRQQVVDQAKGMHPSLAGVLDRGMTVRDWAAPYIAIAQRTLGIADVDLTDTKWSRMADAVDGNGNRRPLTLDEWQRTLRTDERYGYQFTQSARDEAYALVGAIGKAFGRTP